MDKVETCSFRVLRVKFWLSSDCRRVKMQSTVFPRIEMPVFTPSKRRFPGTIVDLEVAFLAFSRVGMTLREPSVL